jgi:outer membrane receptor protein involved in Fe transport
LFGRNATGGVIQIITKDPSLTPSANVYVRYGNYDTTSGVSYRVPAPRRSLSFVVSDYYNSGAHYCAYASRADASQFVRSRTAANLRNHPWRSL